ncbi:MAG TPA: capsule assembly Wzi family protein, partial [Gemmatimonadaceae bacterium]|nr:capsule assembly Wzi family protein [Gemmatimonadaceae bacterium]
ALRIACCAAGIGVRDVGGQASPFIPPTESIYADIDLLVSAGLIDAIAVGARPYTRVEISRLLTEARRNAEGNGAGADWAVPIIDRDVARYAQKRPRPIDLATFELARLSSPFRPVPADPNGSIDAAINPLAGWRGGRTLVDGATAAVETMHSASLGRHVAVAVAPRVAVETDRDRAGTVGRVQAANAVLQFGNFVAELGRDYAVFGPAPGGGLLLSTNAAPLDMVRLSMQRPARLPWWFRRLGPVHAMLLVADLGTERQNHPHAKLVGYRMSIVAHQKLEFGVQVLDETGGRGAPGASFGDRVLDAIPPIDAWRTGSDFQFSNKLAGVDARWRMPDWAGLELYVDGAVDDMDIRRLRSSLLQDGGVIGGLSLSCLVGCGRLRVRAEYHQTGIRYYTHTDFSSGLQTRGIMLGDPLGPRGLGGYLALETGAGSRNQIALSGAYEVRSGNLYASAGQGSHSADFHFVQVEHHPAERRARLLATWTSSARGNRMAAVVSAGAERTTNFAFAGGGRTNALVRIAYEVWP